MVAESFPTGGGDGASQPRRSFIQMIIALMSGALLSKILGFVREIAMALIIGTAIVADAFRTSITLVLLPISFFQSEAVPAVLIPLQQEHLRAGRGPTQLAALMIALAGISVVLMLMLQLFGFLLVDAVVMGFSAPEKALTFEFVRVMALAMPASVALNVLASGEIALGRARISNARAAFQNLSVLAGIACVALGGDYILLGWAFSFAFNGVTLWACLMLMREGNLSFRGIGLGEVYASGREFFRRLRPFIPLPLAEQANIWVERLCTSRLQLGAIASLDYARTLTESFQLIISQPIGLAVLAHADPEGQDAQARAISRAVLAVALPACAFLYIFAEEIVTLIFKRGAFGDVGVFLTSQALQGISIGLWASTLGWILLRLLSSRRRNLRAAFILITAYAVNIAFNAVIAFWLYPNGSSTIMVGLGETIRAFVLLGGVLLSIPNGLRLLPIIGMALPPAALMLLVGSWIESNVAGNLARLFFGGLSLTACITMAFAILIPSLYRIASARLARRQ